MMENKICPTCNGTMELQKRKNRWVCPYCDATFEAEEPPKKEKGMFHEDMFIIDTDPALRRQQQRGSCSVLAEQLHESFK